MQLRQPVEASFPGLNQRAALPFHFAVGVRALRGCGLGVLLAFGLRLALLGVQRIGLQALRMAAMKQRDVLAPAGDKRAQLGAGGVEGALRQACQRGAVERGERVRGMPGVVGRDARGVGMRRTVTAQRFQPLLGLRHAL